MIATGICAGFGYLLVLVNHSAKTNISPSGKFRAIWKTNELLSAMSTTHYCHPGHMHIAAIYNMLMLADATWWKCSHSQTKVGCRHSFIVWKLALDTLSKESRLPWNLGGCTSQTELAYFWYCGKYRYIDAVHFKNWNIYLFNFLWSSCVPVNGIRY